MKTKSIEYKFNLIENNTNFILVILPKVKNNFYKSEGGLYYIKLKENEIVLVKDNYLKEVVSSKTFFSLHNCKYKKTVYKYKSVTGDEIKGYLNLDYEISQDKYKNDYMEKPTEEILAELEHAKTELLEEYLQMLEDTRIEELEKQNIQIEKENKYNKIKEYLGI